jgi:hypothetical protein
MSFVSTIADISVERQVIKEDLATEEKMIELKNN